MSLRPAWLTFRRYAAATTAVTLTLVSLGVYTAATGSGLACQAQWPLCSDQLIPALTINPDFIEWFHRVWAMGTGFAIIGLAAWSWLDDRERRVRLAATGAVAILPLQITVGAVTVTVGGLVPGGYTVSTHAAHLLVALTIFTLLGLATLWAFLDERAVTATHLRRALSLGVGGLLVGAVLSRAVPLLTYSPGAQGWFYAAGLLAHLGLLSAVVLTPHAALREAVARRTRGLAGAALALLFCTLLLGRDLVLYTATWRLINRVALVGALAAAPGALLVVRRGAEAPDAAAAESGAPASAD